MFEIISVEDFEMETIQDWDDDLIPFDLDEECLDQMEEILKEYGFSEDDFSS